MNIRQRFASVVLAALMAIGGTGAIASARGHGHGDAGHGIDALIHVVADIESAQFAYASGRYVSANHRAVHVLVDLRSIHRLRAIDEIGCGDQLETWFDLAIVKMIALRMAAIGQGTHWNYAANPRNARTLALAVYRRAAARYETAANALVDCVLDALPTPPLWLLDLGL